MQKVITHLFFLSLAVSSFSIKAINCTKVEGQNLYKNTVEQIKSQINEMNSLLNGDSKQITSPALIFGVDFDIAKSQEIIKKLEINNSEKNGISVEHEAVHNCINKHNKKEQVEELEKLSKERNSIKIALIKRNKELNNFIKSNLDSNQSLPMIKSKLENEKFNAEQIKETLTKNTNKNDFDVLIEKNSEKRELLIIKGQLEKNKLDIINIGLKYNKELEDSITKFEEKSQTLNQISLRTNDERENGTVRDDFEQIQTIWKQIINLNFNQIFKTSLSIEFPNAPKLPRSSEDQELKPLINEIQNLANENKEIKKSLSKKITDKKNYEIKLQTTLLLQTNILRSKIFQKLPSKFVLLQLTQKSFYLDITDEIKASPYKIMTFVYSKVLYLRENYLLGKEGLKKLAFDILSLLLFGLLITIINLILGKSYSITNDFSSKLIRKYHQYSLIKNAVSIWNKYKDNYTTLVWLCICYYCTNIDWIKDYNFIIKLISVFLIYKIIKSLFVIFLGRISRLDLKNFQEFKDRANQTSRYLANIYLFYAVTLLFIEGTAGKVFLYSIINTFILIISIIRIINTSKIWRNELQAYLERNFSGLIVEKLQKISKALPESIIPLFYLLFILILSVFDVFIKLTENFEISKKISANIFRKQLESIEKDENSSLAIPNEYFERFVSSKNDLDIEFIISDEKTYKVMMNDIEEWILEQSEEHSLVIFGDKGVGKTTLLLNVISDFKEGHNVDTLCLKIPSKITNEEELHDFISSALKIEKLKDIKQTIYEFDKSLDKKIIIYIDEAQNVFLSQERGFQAYYAIINVINLNTKNIFWSLSFNKYSWLYLDRAFGKNQFFRNVYELKGWSDVKIKDLILSRHKLSKFRLSYDSLINTTRSQDEIDRYASVESKFFKLLWEMSNGNPRLALQLWTTALSRKNLTTFNVNLPKAKLSVNLDRLTDDFLFTIAHVVKHENLSSKEIESTTNLSEVIVRNTIKMALELRLLHRDERRRYLIDISSQNQVIKFLRAKNYLYGQ